MERDNQDRKRMIILLSLVLGGIFLGFVLLIYVAVVGL